MGYEIHSHGLHALPNFDPDKSQLFANIAHFSISALL
jgi:hypothetical protein